MLESTHLGWHHRPAAFTEADAAKTITLAAPTQDCGIAVFEIAACLTIRQRDRLRATAGQLQQGAGLVRIRGPDNVPEPNRSPGRQHTSKELEFNSTDSVHQGLRDRIWTTRGGRRGSAEPS